MPSPLPGFGLLTGRWTEQRMLAERSSGIYGRLVARARDPVFYATFGVPDTPEGRLEMILAHVVLVLQRLGSEGRRGETLGRAIAERFVTDMDDCMREMGVSDIKVPQKVNKAAAALFDRTRDYSAALASSDPDLLPRLVAAHLLDLPGGDDSTPPAMADRLAAYLRTQAVALAAIDTATVIDGRFDLPALDAQGPAS